MFPDATASSVVSMSSTSSTTTQVENIQMTQNHILWVRNSLFRREMSILRRRNICWTHYIHADVRKKVRIIEWSPGDIIPRQHYKKFTSKLTFSSTFNRKTKIFMRNDQSKVKWKAATPQFLHTMFGEIFPNTMPPTPVARNIFSCFHNSPHHWSPSSWWRWHGISRGAAWSTTWITVPISSNRSGRPPSRYRN